MVKRYERQEIVAKMRDEIDKGRAIFDAFAGTGISAKFAEAVRDFKDIKVLGKTS